MNSTLVMVFCCSFSGMSFAHRDKDGDDKKIQQEGDARREQAHASEQRTPRGFL